MGGTAVEVGCGGADALVASEGLEDVNRRALVGKRRKKGSPSAMTACTLHTGATIDLSKGLREAVC